MFSRTTLAAAAATLSALAFAGPAAAAFDPAYELSNFSKIEERFRYVVSTPAFQAQLREKSVLREAQAAQIQAGDPDRFFFGQLCWQKMDGCAGEVRTYDWSTRGAGLATPVSWVARNGSVISGHVFATPDGPAKRPGAVLTTGSVQAPEELYWAAAQALAKAGYVVLTWDVQGQGYSDTFGEGADRNDGVPSQSGQPFYDGTEDALDFFFSSESSPFAPRKSCSTGTSHVAKQVSRLAAGKASAYNPFASLLDTAKVGVFGHSLGAGAVSYIGQLDPRVKAIVAYDNLGAQSPTATAPPVTCTSGASPRPAKVPSTKPALGISNDYGLTPNPNLSEPNPDAKTSASKILSAAGTDTMQLVVRGGTHYESSNIPNPAFGATLRGNDLEAFYTVAWFDRYVKGDRSATARLLTQRWRNDSLAAAVDPDKDPNDLSRYYKSRVDIAGTDGSRVVCESLREGCAALAAEGDPKPYDVIARVQAKGADDGPGLTALKSVCGVNTTDPVGATGAPPATAPQTPPCNRTGATGTSGTTGTPGSTGPANQQGQSGAQGNADQQGQPGTQGAAGNQGATSNQAPTGQQSAMGSASPAGPAGAPGPTGDSPGTTRALRISRPVFSAKRTRRVGSLQVRLRPLGASQPTDVEVRIFDSRGRVLFSRSVRRLTRSTNVRVRPRKGVLRRIRAGRVIVEVIAQDGGRRVTVRKASEIVR